MRCIVKPFLHDIVFANSFAFPQLFLEGGGGGNQKESYNHAMWFYASDHVRFTGLKAGTKPFFFITGDEGNYGRVDIDWLQGHISKNPDQELHLHERAGKSQRCLKFTIPKEVAGAKAIEVRFPKSVAPSGSSTPKKKSGGDETKSGGEDDMMSVRFSLDSLYVDEERKKRAQPGDEVS